MDQSPPTTPKQAGLGQAQPPKKKNTGLIIGLIVGGSALFLAAAGLALAVVLIIVPSAQREERDTNRRADVALVATAINEYMARNNAHPANWNDLSPLIGNQLVHYDAGIGYNQSINPAGLWAGQPPVDGQFPTSDEIDFSNPGAGILKASNPEAVDLMMIVLQAGCRSGQGGPEPSPGSRSVAIIYWLEGYDEIGCLEI